VSGLARVAITPYAPRHLDVLIPMWRAAFERGVGIVDPHPLAEQREFFVTAVLPGHDVRVALLGDTLVGFVAATPDSIAQLHVHVDHHRCGIGRQLLAWAKAQSGGRLWLYTFARNRGARAFYEAHGFTAVAFGFEPTWQLDDVRYEWSADAEPALGTGANRSGGV
jgi:ribosomal protein S18 acetylase RimI-like enzyme